jgi:capsular polysaccharide biosynthesis protein
VDPYTQARSAERIGANLAQIMKTTDFYNKVINSNAFSFDRDEWKNLNDRAQRKKWAKDVRATTVYGSGLMSISVYSYSQKEAINLSNAVTQTLAAQGWEYLGGDVAIKVVSSPLASRWFARPNILINSVVGLLVGILISSLWVIRYKQRRLFGK